MIKVIVERAKLEFDGNFVPTFVERANLITFSLSNDFDYLIVQLKDQLYAKSNILTRKLLVVPGDEALRVFENRSLEDEKLKLNFGYRSINLNLAIEVLAKTLNPQIKFPKKKGLRQVLLETIFDKIEKQEHSFDHLKNYLSKQAIHLNFFDQLASNFSLYGVNGILPEIKESLSFQKELFDELKVRFDFPLDVLQSSKEDIHLLAGFEVHLFGFTTIPPLYLSFFKKISKLVPIYFYFLSPCKKLSLDFLHDRMQVSGFDRLDKNPLIANFQTGLKPLIKFYVDESSFQNEAFFLQEEPNSLKEALKLSLLDGIELKDLIRSKQSVREDLYLFKAPTPYREVEEMVVFLKESKTKFELSFDQMVILCANLNQYAPLLAYHFEKNQIPYRIESKTILHDKQRELKTFFSLLSSRFSIEDLRLLLSLKMIQASLLLSSKDVYSMKKILDQSTITFAYDREHRLFFLKTCEVEDLYPGTVEHFFDQLYLGALFSSDQLEKLPFGKGHFSIDEHLMECFQLLHHLLEKMISFYRAILEKRRSFQEFLKMTLLFFEGIIDQEIVLNLRSQFQDELEESIGIPYEGTLFLQQLEEKLSDNKKGIRSKEFEKVACLGFDEGCFIGKKWVFILGADDENFPKTFEKNSLDISVQEDVITPLQTQKGLFLQLLSANIPYLYFSYSTIGFDQKEKILSLFVEKLFQYLDLYFVDEENHPITKKLIKTIPETVFDPARFIHPHFDSIGYQLYQNSYEKEKKPHLFPSVEKMNQEQFIIELSSLEEVLKNPVKFFAKETLKLFVPFVDDKKEFNCPSYKAKRFLVDSLSKELELYFEQLKYRGKLPQYGFLKFYEDKLKKACFDLRKNLALSVDSIEQGRKLKLSKNRSSVQKRGDQKWLLPAMTIKMDCGKTVQIVGSIDELVTGALLLPSETKKEFLWSFWPRIIAYEYCSKLIDQKESFCVGLDGKKKKIILKNPLETMKKIVEYTLLAKEKMSLLYESTIKKGMKLPDEKEEFFELLIRKKEQDPYFQFFQLKDGAVEPFISKLQILFQEFDQTFGEIDERV